VSAADLARLGYATVDGLTDGTTYTFTVTAANDRGSSAPSLPTAPVTPTTVATTRVALTWPDAPAGQPDNVTAGGQVIQASASGSTLGVLLTATHGPASGTGEIDYTDGTSQPLPLSAPDWYSTPPSGSTIAFTMTYRNRPTNVQQTHQVTMYYAGVQLDPGKTVSQLVLPNISSPTSSGPALHIFAMTVGSTPVDLAPAFDNVGITDDGATDAGNIDGSRSSLSAPALAAAGVTPGSTVMSPLPVPGQPTSVSARSGNGAVSIHFTPPASTGVTPIIGYTITAPGITPVQVTGHDELWAGSGDGLCTAIGGLTNGVSYTFQITANNLAGASRPASVTVTPGGS
jgi:hypothetical protein